MISPAVVPLLAWASDRMSTAIGTQVRAAITEHAKSLHPGAAGEVEFARHEASADARLKALRETLGDLGRDVRYIRSVSSTFDPKFGTAASAVRRARAIREESRDDPARRRPTN